MNVPCCCLDGRCREARSGGVCPTATAGLASTAVVRCIPTPSGPPCPCCSCILYFSLPAPLHVRRGGGVITPCCVRTWGGGDNPLLCEHLLLPLNDIHTHTPLPPRQKVQAYLGEPVSALLCVRFKAPVCDCCEHGPCVSINVRPRLGHLQTHRSSASVVQNTAVVGDCQHDQ